MPKAMLISVTVPEIEGDLVLDVMDDLQRAFLVAEARGRTDELLKKQVA